MLVDWSKTRTMSAALGHVMLSEIDIQQQGEVKNKTRLEDKKFIKIWQPKAGLVQYIIYNTAHSPHCM